MVFFSCSPCCCRIVLTIVSTPRSWPLPARRSSCPATSTSAGTSRQWSGPRTNLNMNEVKNGDVSLRMSDVRPSDAGKYQCLILHTRNSHVAATLELVVCAAAEPTLSRFQVPGVGVTLQCEASGRSPQLEITFLDDQEKNISAGNLKRHQDPRGCVTVVRRVTVLTETNRVTCRVHQPPMNEPRDAHVYITDTVKTINSCAKTCSVAVTVAILFLSGLGVAIYSCKKYGNCVGRKIKSAKESREESETNGKKEVHRPTDPSHIVVNIPRQIWKEEEQGFKLQGKETQELKSKQTPVAFFQGLWIERSPPKSSSGFSKPSSRIRHRVSHGSNPNPVASPNNNDPESLNLPQNKDPKPGVPGQTPALVRPIKRNLSSPALGAMSSSSSSASSSKDTHLEYSVVTRNRYGVLSDLSEVSPLLPPGRMHLCTD
ncbi:uncharacterized protein LOC118284567 isoform X4 [Scophthalmus maximus]|uniref:uncharacterized protein LOC118284567 isoform X4 n=1 Tax=Scophthalmus maximus TaxID=52904 RepID=UPI001FA86444|nr:uncharacterized protein LOC118284567 isoform X4 [Scophthalmus maximus]